MHDLHITSPASVKMARRFHGVLSYTAFTLFLGYALVSTRWVATGVERDFFYISAVVSCATSCTCGWITRDNDEKKSCGVPTEANKANISFRNYFPGSTVTYTCFKGWSLCGHVEKEVTCLKNGSWEELGSTRDSVDCRKTAETGGRAHYNLEIYERLADETQVTTNKIYTTFRFVVPADSGCNITKTSCGVPMEANKAIISFRNYFPGSTATYTCFKGWSLCGHVQKEVTCLKNGSWKELGSNCRQDPLLTRKMKDQILCPVRVGTVIEFIGIPMKNVRIGMKLLSSSSFIPLHVSVDCEHGKCFLGCMNFGKTLNKFREKTPFRCVLRIERQFKITIMVKTSQYVITVDGESNVSIPHGNSLSDIRSYAVKGSVRVISIKFIS